MSYQDIYKGMIKQASAEQVKELAEMLKTAALTKQAAPFKFGANTSMEVRKFVQDWMHKFNRRPSKKVVNDFMRQQTGGLPKTGPSTTAKPSLEFPPAAMGANRRAEKILGRATKNLQDMAQSNQRQALANAGRNAANSQWRSRTFKYGIPAGLGLTAIGTTTGAAAGKKSMEEPLNKALEANKKLTAQNTQLKNQSGWAKIWRQFKAWLERLWAWDSVNSTTK